MARDGRILTRRLQSACKGRHTSCSVIRLDEVKRETRLVEWNLEVADVSNWAPMFLRCIHTHHAKLPGLCLRNPGHPSCLRASRTPDGHFCDDAPQFCLFMGRVAYLPRRGFPFRGDSLLGEAASHGRFQHLTGERQFEPVKACSPITTGLNLWEMQETEAPVTSAGFPDLRISLKGAGT